MKVTVGLLAVALLLSSCFKNPIEKVADKISDNIMSNMNDDSLRDRCTESYLQAYQVVKQLPNIGATAFISAEKDQKLDEIIRMKPKKNKQESDAVSKLYSKEVERKNRNKELDQAYELKKKKLALTFKEITPEIKSCFKNYQDEHNKCAIQYKDITMAKLDCQDWVRSKTYYWVIKNWKMSEKVMGKDVFASFKQISELPFDEVVKYRLVFKNIKDAITEKSTTVEQMKKIVDPEDGIGIFLNWRYDPFIKQYQRKDLFAYALTLDRAEAIDGILSTLALKVTEKDSYINKYLKARKNENDKITNKYRRRYYSCNVIKTLEKHLNDKTDIQFDIKRCQKKSPFKL